MAVTPQVAVALKNIRNEDKLASQIATLWETWKGNRSTWEAEKTELRNFIFATDTTKTSNRSLPWKNTTTMPKLAQIRDNLHANYMHALFPHDDWFVWQPANKESASLEKRTAIEAYMKSKLRYSGFYETISRLVYDYIDYGNAFGEVTFISENHTDTAGSAFSVYTGPKLLRISPFDIVFDLTATDFKHTPKVTRSLINLGSLEQAFKTDPNFKWAEVAVQRASKLRGDCASYKPTDINKWSGLNVDGFGSAHAYLTSGVVEILEFEGDIYDEDTKEFLLNHKVIVVDRSYVVHTKPFESWLGRSSKEHVGWRLRPDNLMAMGPLDNLVGMQYRVDHLENLKADVFDQIAHPITVTYGWAEDWEWKPGENINVGEEGRVEVLRPDATALNADFQIQSLLAAMEEFAGAPKQAMGIRTPGEKTAFEVSALENAAGRIFQDKTEYFEVHFVEPILNQMLEEGRRNLDVPDVVTSLDSDFGVAEFLTIKKEDIQAKGRLAPVGARHFARQNQIVQNLLGVANSALYQDPMVNSHISGLAIAKMIEELLDFEKFGLVQKNIRISEEAELRKDSNLTQEQEANELLTQNQVEQEQLANGGLVQ